jgi:hypothetical protein
LSTSKGRTTVNKSAKRIITIIMIPREFFSASDEDDAENTNEFAIKRISVTIDHLIYQSQTR